MAQQQRSRIDAILDEVFDEEWNKDHPSQALKSTDMPRMDEPVDGEIKIKIAIRGSDRVVEMTILPIKSRGGKLMSIPTKSLDDISTFVEKIHGETLSKYVSQANGGIALNAMGKPTYTMFKDKNKDVIDDEFNKRVEEASKAMMVDSALPESPGDAVDLGNDEEQPRPYDT